MNKKTMNVFSLVLKGARVSFAKKMTGGLMY
jgi:hypothetical protein